MSKLIVEMRNNPKNCAECLACAAGMNENVFYCAIERSIIAESVLMNRQSWCPIVGVLPDEHGDLIDRDVMQEKAFQMNFHGRISERELFLFNRSLSEMPIVIAAEREDDGTTAD